MQRYSVQGYVILITSYSLNIRTPNELSLRLNGYNPATNVEEPLTITVMNENSAKVETSRHIIEINYIEDPDDPNGQIGFSEKVPGSDIPNWFALLNAVPKQVIKVLIQIVNDDEAADQYLVTNNNQNENLEENNEPGSNGNNTNSNDPTVSGGKRRTRQKKGRKTRRSRR